MGTVACASANRKNLEPIEKNELNEILEAHHRQERDFEYLAEITHFDMDTIRKLHQRFVEIDSSINNDNLIDGDELMGALNLKKQSLLGARIFAYFDKAKQSTLNFRNFATALNSLSENASTEEKIQISFYLYDLNQDGLIDGKEIRCLVDAALAESPQLWSEEQKQSICEATLQAADTNQNGVVEFEEYKNYCIKNPQIMKSFTINIQEILDSSYSKQRSMRSERQNITLTRGPLSSNSKRKSKIKFKWKNLNRFSGKKNTIKKISDASEILNEEYFK